MSDQWLLTYEEMWSAIGDGSADNRPHLIASKVAKAQARKIVERLEGIVDHSEVRNPATGEVYHIGDFDGREWMALRKEVGLE